MTDRDPTPERTDFTPHNDQYVIHYDFGSVNYDIAIEEFKSLIDDLEQTGLCTAIRPGYERSILVIVKAPRHLLDKFVYNSRVKDWLYAVTHTHPSGDINTVLDQSFEAEDLLATYHLVHWPKEMGGAAVTPGVGQWENVKSIFPLHNKPVNRSLLKHISRRIFLTVEDFDQIRDLFGSKVAFYFAFIQIYLIFLTFPAIAGIAAWLWLPKYSMLYAILTSIWCCMFLEWWKLQEVELSIRWNVRGVQKSKITRPEYKYEKEFVDANGRKIQYFPKWKHIARQTIQIPFYAMATLALGAVISSVFAIEVFISEVYQGPHQDWLEYAPSIVLAVAIPYISSAIERVARTLTTYENHRTADAHDVSLMQKIFVLNIVTNYLPILLVAFVYIPYGDSIMPRLRKLLVTTFPPLHRAVVKRKFTPNSDKLRREVIALTLTGQLSSFFQENILPLLKHQLASVYRFYKRVYAKQAMLLTLVEDDDEETEFLESVRNQSTLAHYNVHADTAELVLQFGYLALFSPAWPLIPFGFLINNVIELRSDFAKICFEHQRPAPARADGIGPWVLSLELLTWIGSISTAAIVHLFGNDTFGIKSWFTLPVAIFVSEHTLLLLRAITRWMFERYGSKQLRKERDERYARRLHYLEEIEARKGSGVNLSVSEGEKCKLVPVMGAETFWTKQAADGQSTAAGLKLINLMRKWEEDHSSPKVKQN